MCSQICVKQLMDFEDFTFSSTLKATIMIASIDTYKFIVLKNIEICLKISEQLST